MIHALFVAIDNYPIAHHRLNGCVNDATALLNYLEGNYECEELNITTIFNEKATKANIIKGFEHFKDAKDGDTCLFYYSGHGSQATAPIEFRHIDPDGKVETLVCHDSRLPGGKDLMDKELSFLIWEANLNKDIHFAAIFDCCHSGSNTRSHKIKTRKADVRNDRSAIKDFHGYMQYQQSDNVGRKEFTPPSGQHVQLAAARANQTAKELRIGQETRGAFTYNLIALLEQNNGELTYSQLITHLKAKVANYVKEQTPQIDALEPEDKNRYFLGQIPKGRPQSYAVNYDKKTEQWIVNIGAINNLPQGQESKVLLRINVKGEMQEATVTKIGMLSSVLAPLAGLDKEKSYEAIIDKIPVQPLKLAFSPDSDKEGMALIVTAAKDHPSPYYALETDTDKADYWIRAVDNCFQLVVPNESRPVFRRVKDFDLNMAKVFMIDTAAVAHWHHVKEIQNAKTTLRKEEYSIELYRVDEPGAWEADDNCAAELVNIDEAVVFNYDYDVSQPEEKRWLRPAFRAKVKNTGNRTLYFSAVYLISNYGIKNKFMPSQALAPGEEAWVLDRLKSGQTFKCIPLDLADAYLAYGINEISEQIKFFISTLELDTDQYNQDALELDNPVFDTERVGRSEANYPPQHDWRVVDIELKIVRPAHEKQITAGGKGQLASSMEIQMPEGVSCMAMLNGEQEASRSLANAGTPMKDMPSGWTKHDLGLGMSNKPPVNVLEFYSTEGMEKVNADNPIKIKLSDMPAEDEFMVPVGFDTETGMYYPVGMIDEDGMVNIETLPAPTAVGTRSLGGSIKIFFQKTIGRFIPYVYNHPQLSLGGFEEAASDENTALGIKVSYSLDDKKTKEAVTGAQKIVLFIHGIIGDTASMPKALRLVKNTEGKTLEEEYDLWLTFDYENLNTPIQDTAAALKAKLEAIGLGAEHGKTFHIIAHSMGGLVSRWMVEQLEGNQIVNHLYMLGTPNQGSPYGSLYEMATPLLATAVNGASFLQPYILPLKYVGKFLDKLFDTLTQMNVDSDFLKELNAGKDPQIPYTIIAGNTKLIPPNIQDKHNTLLKKLMARFKSRGHYDALDILLFKEDNDIAASTKSIGEIPGTEKWQTPPNVIVVASDHISYFGDPDSLDAMGEVLL